MMFVREQMTITLSVRGLKLEERCGTFRSSMITAQGKICLMCQVMGSPG